jgi:4-amino-4-deoxy-L-arabinose transferase-like glycosyltransferase
MRTAQVEQEPNRGREAGQGSGAPSTYLLIAALAVAFIAHAYNMFNYPLYLGDEGIYVEQAWAVLRQGRLSPYTYFYDHAPAGWLMIAAWILLLPKQFLSFGLAVNSGRVLMLLLHVASTYLLYRTTKRLSGSDLAAFGAAIVFSLSPLALFYQRMVLLDNIMTFWVLLSLHLALAHRGRVMTLVASGFAFGLALLTKENAIFFAPVLGYLLYTEAKGRPNFRFVVAGWTFTTWGILSLYPLYAFLKDELLPSSLASLTMQNAGEHVSLIDTLLWQATRSQGSVLDPSSLFWVFSFGRWLPKDSFILAAGGAAILINVIIGMLNPRLRRNYLVVAGMALAYAFYLARGSFMLEFYVVPLLPFLSMNLAVATQRVFNVLPGRYTGSVMFVVCLVVLSGVYIYDDRDHFTLNLTQLQTHQLRFIRETIPGDARVVIDDDLWVDLHERNGKLPVYPNSHSHWKVTGDPDIRDKLLRGDWRNIDYIVMSNKMLETLLINRGQEQMVLEALDNSDIIYRYQKGDVAVEVWKVRKQATR